MDRYVLKELAVPLFVGTGAVVLMFLGNTLIFYAGQVFQKEIPLEAVLQYLVFKIPQTLNMTLPVGMTIAASLTVTRLTRESEITALRAAGIPIRRILLPIFLAGAVVAGISYWLQEWVTPKSEARAMRTLRNIFATGEAIPVQSNVLLKLNAGEYLASIGTIRKGQQGEVVMEDVGVFQRPKLGEEWWVHAPRATYRDGIFTLQKPIVRQMEGMNLRVLTPDTYTLNIRVGLDTFFGQKQPEAMTSSELNASIRNWKAQGQDTRKAEVAYHSKFSVPAACFVFAVFAPVFAFIFARGGAFIGLLVSIVSVFVYYNIWVLSSQLLSGQWLLPPVVGAWLPNVLFCVVGAIVLWRCE
jgi:lipopolysaccharide export system permease protein